METLLKFIINNPFVAIIILGFLISMFGNKNKKAGMPPFGGGKQANQGRPLEQQPDRSAEQRTHETHADRSRPYPNRFDRSEEQDWIPEQPAASSAVQPERTALEHRLQESARLREGQRRPADDQIADCRGNRARIQPSPAISWQSRGRVCRARKRCEELLSGRRFLVRQEQSVAATDKLPVSWQLNRKF